MDDDLKPLGKSVEEVERESGERDTSHDPDAARREDGAGLIPPAVIPVSGFPGQTAAAIPAVATDRLVDTDGATTENQHPDEPTDNDQA
ncbi:hypothetical protein HNR42_000630 [Deinobacterium chartae]|uniref:Uncharacterized protein n=1 Tax=Deinobacterium chartae TaxID=521158 RepID=A0A841HWC2_9DEIO|nr:hypothetical protein [Deinobacterium chartae]MBB6097216.1 hypothetical protein [Deinobacterium chartae]